ncbi:hypothetical protein C8J56DRAFT_888807 [Mycena floridula]|nr:hypothetical protein C8J56DRAFT_888807 [Mycena floridula]
MKIDREEHQVVSESCSSPKTAKKFIREQESGQVTCYLKLRLKWQSGIPGCKFIELSTSRRSLGCRAFQAGSSRAESSRFYGFQGLRLGHENFQAVGRGFKPSLILVILSTVITGIAISKRWNQLKGDIIEALQFLKCLYHTNLIFHEVMTDDELAEMEEENLEEDGGDPGGTAGDTFSWDSLLGQGLAWQRCIRDSLGTRGAGEVKKGNLLDDARLNAGIKEDRYS